MLPVPVGFELVHWRNRLLAILMQRRSAFETRLARPYVLNVKSDSSHLPLWLVQRLEPNTDDTAVALLEQAKAQVSDNAWKSVEYKSNDRIAWVPGVTASARLACSHTTIDALVPAIFYCSFDEGSVDSKRQESKTLPSMSCVANLAVETKFKAEFKECSQCKCCGCNSLF
jgi:hypothetical protein